MSQRIDLASARKTLNLTQADLAEQWGLNLATIWRWENEGVPNRGAGRKLVDDLIARASKPLPKTRGSNAGVAA